MVAISAGKHEQNVAETAAEKNTAHKINCRPNGHAHQIYLVESWEPKTQRYTGGEALLDKAAHHTQPHFRFGLSNGEKSNVIKCLSTRETRVNGEKTVLFEGFICTRDH